MTNQNRLLQSIERFKLLLSGAVLIILSFIHIHFRPIEIDASSSGWLKLGDLLLTCIPSAIVVLIAIPIAYWLFSKGNIDDKANGNEENDKIELLKMVKKQYPSKGKRGSLTGTWCHCWENKSDELSEYEVGTMIIDHNKKSNKIFGVVFRGNSVWEFEGKFDHGKLECKYVGDSVDGSFVLKIENWDKLKGYWVGPIRDNGVEKVAKSKAFIVRHEHCGRKCFHREVGEMEKNKQVLPCEIA